MAVYASGQLNTHHLIKKNSTQLPTVFSVYNEGFLDPFSFESEYNPFQNQIHLSKKEVILSWQNISTEYSNIYGGYSDAL